VQFETTTTTTTATIIISGQKNTTSLIGSRETWHTYGRVYVWANTHTHRHTHTRTHKCESFSADVGQQLTKLTKEVKARQHDSLRASENAFHFHNNSVALTHKQTMCAFGRATAEAEVEAAAATEGRQFHYFSNY